MYDIATADRKFNELLHRAQNTRVPCRSAGESCRSMSGPVPNVHTRPVAPEPVDSAVPAAGNSQSKLVQREYAVSYTHLTLPTKRIV